jgi:mono/diheme cytochrome c family protein
MQLNRWIAAGFAVAVGMSPAFADVPAKPTFTKDVLPIMQENCQECHREKPVKMSGLVAPFSLVSYDQARPWAKAISKAVSSRYMPPWDATEALHGVFRNERSLTDDEIDTIVRWVEQGAKRGNPKDAPTPLKFANKEWWIGEPNLIVPLPEKIWVGDEVEDWQPLVNVTLTEEQLPEDRWIRVIEAQADSAAVHHIVVYGTNPHQKPRTEAAGRLGYGNLGGLAPGAEPSELQDGYGILLKKGSTLRISMHYHKEPGAGTGSWDQSRLGFFFYEPDAEVTPINIEPIGDMRFAIPPGDDNYLVKMDHTFDKPFEILNMLPHMHLRGKAARYTAFYPDGKSEVLLDVPTYDYNWQTSYEYPEPKQFPAGTRIQVEMRFDNSANNPSNPDPNKEIHFGGKTTDEMALGWMSYSWTDENPSTD